MKLFPKKTLSSGLLTWLPWNHQNTQFSLQKSPLFCSDRRKFLFFRWNLEPVTPLSRASLILRESRNGKRKSLSFLAILALLFVASCLICWQIMDHGDVSSGGCHWNAFKIFCLTRKWLLLCLIQMWNARLLYLLYGMHTAKCENSCSSVSTNCVPAWVRVLWKILSQQSCPDTGHSQPQRKLDHFKLNQWRLCMPGKDFDESVCCVPLMSV